MVRSWRVSSALQVTQMWWTDCPALIFGETIPSMSSRSHGSRAAPCRLSLRTLLVWAAVVDLARAQEALRAVDVLDLPAEPVAVAVAAPGARRALGGAVSADPGEFAVLPVNALVRAPVAPLEGLVGVFADLPRDGRQAYADLLRDGPCGLLGREAELDAAPLGAVHLLLSFFHLIFPLLPRRDWRREGI